MQLLALMLATAAAWPHQKQQQQPQHHQLSSNGHRMENGKYSYFIL